MGITSSGGSVKGSHTWCYPRTLGGTPKSPCKLGVPPMGRDSMFKFGGDSDRRTVTPASQVQGPSPVTRAARDGRGHGVTDLTTVMTLAIQLSQAVLTISLSTNRGVRALCAGNLDRGYRPSQAVGSTDRPSH